MKFPDGWPSDWSEHSPWGGSRPALKQKRWYRDVHEFGRRRTREYFTTAHCSACGEIAATMLDGDELGDVWQLGEGVGWVDAVGVPIGWACSIRLNGGSRGERIMDIPLACSDACEFKVLVNAGIAPEVARAMTGLVDPAGVATEQVPIEVVERMSVENQRLRKMLAAAGVHVPPEFGGGS